MKLPTQSTGGSFEKCPAGNHLAVCYEVLDLGTQDTTYKGETKPKHLIWIGWETPMESMEDGRPFVIGRRYTLSSHENSALRRDLESWRGKAFTDEDFGTFPIESIIGKGCFLNVVHSENGDRTYANVQAVTGLPKGTAVPEQSNESTYLSLDPEDFDPDVYAKLSERMRETIGKSPEFSSLRLKGKVEESSVPDSVDEEEAAF